MCVMYCVPCEEQLLDLYTLMTYVHCGIVLMYTVYHVLLYSCKMVYCVAVVMNNDTLCYNTSVIVYNGISTLCYCSHV